MKSSTHLKGGLSNRPLNAIEEVSGPSASAELLSMSGKNLRRASQLFREPTKLASLSLNAHKTAELTAANVGHFVPVYENKLSHRTLFLTVRGSPVDQEGERVTWMVRSLQRLVGRGNIEHWYIEPDGERVSKNPGGRSETLADLAGRYRDHRLVFVGTGDGFLTPDGMSLCKWAEVLRLWETRLIATPVPTSEWGVREAKLSKLFGHLPYSATPEGISGLARDMSSGCMPERVAFKKVFRRWREDAFGLVIRLPSDEKKEWEEVKSELLSLLDERAYDWLKATAVYPSLRWDVTLLLGLKLTDELGQPLFDEDRARRLCLLPWFRSGSMPAWVRRHLLADLSRKHKEGAIEVICELLSRSGGGEPSSTGQQQLIRLPVAVSGSLFRGTREAACSDLALLSEDTLFFQAVSDHEVSKVGAQKAILERSQPNKSPPINVLTWIHWAIACSIATFNCFIYFAIDRNFDDNLHKLGEHIDALKAWLPWIFVVVVAAVAVYGRKKARQGINDILDRVKRNFVSADSRPATSRYFRYLSQTFYFVPLIVGFSATYLFAAVPQMQEVYLGIVEDADYGRGIAGLAAVCLFSALLYAWNHIEVSDRIDAIYPDHGDKYFHRRLLDVRDLSCGFICSLPWFGLFIGLAQVYRHVLDAVEAGLTRGALRGLPALPDGVISAAAITLAAYLSLLALFSRFRKNAESQKRFLFSCYGLTVVFVAVPLFAPDATLMTSRLAGPLAITAFVLIEVAVAVRLVFWFFHRVVSVIVAIPSSLLLVTDWLPLGLRQAAIALLPLVAVGALTAGIMRTGGGGVEGQPEETTAKAGGDLAVTFHGWLAERRTGSSRYPVFVVAAQGGGIYAASTAGTFLATMQDHCPAFARHVFAISAVSGGSIGASLFNAAFADSIARGTNRKAPVDVEPGCDSLFAKPGEL